MRHVRLLARTFFVRMFESDLMPAGLPQVQLIVWSVVLLGTPALVQPAIYSQKYARLWFEPGTLSGAIATDRIVLITYAMIAMGFVALVVWEGAYPDRRDARILGVLPVPEREFIAGRMCALAGVFGLFFATVGFLPSLMFATLSFSYGQPCGFLRGTAAHLTAVLAATALVFALVIAVQCLLVTVLGRSAAQRVAVLMQVVFAIALVEMLFFLPQIGGTMRDGNLAPDWLSSPVARWMPSVWFFGLYEVLSGFGGRNAFPLAGVAAASASIATATAAILYAASHSRMALRALETPPHDPLFRGSLRRIGARVLDAAFARVDAVSAALLAFTLRTLLRSRQHRMLLALYVGLGLALVISALIPPALQRGLAAFAAPRVAVLSAPLVMIFFTIVGMRVLFGIPVEPKANWPVRLHEPANRRAAINGVRMAMMAAGVFPFVAAAAAVGMLLWPGRIAAMHAVVCSLMGWLLIEALLIGFFKLPFTCTFFPGRSRLKTLWPLYLTAFTTYCYSTAGLEIVMFRHPRVFVTFCCVAGVLLAVAIHTRIRLLESEPGLRFEEEDPDGVFQGFRLSEGLAAQPRSN
jgi:hypothetical protein